ncbi:MAG: hypothetical protein ACRECO_14975 [Xanthobacteraceae bacterium]
MTIIRKITAALTLAIGLSLIPVGASAASEQQCRHNASEYVQAIRHLEAQAATARVRADANPLYESDLAYYVSVLADARACLRNITPVATASR